MGKTFKESPLYRVGMSDRVAIGYDRKNCKEVQSKMTEQALKNVNIALGSIMSDMNKKWAKEKVYSDWDRQQVKGGKHRLIFGKHGIYQYRSEWSKLWRVHKHNGRIHISYGLGVEHKRMSAKIQRKILAIDEELLRLRKKQQNILARHWKNAKEVTNQQLYNQYHKIKETLKQYGID